MRVGEQQDNAVRQAANFEKLSQRLMLSRDFNEQLIEANEEHTRNKAASQRAAEKLRADYAIASNRSSELVICLRNLEENNQSFRELQ